MLLIRTKIANRNSHLSWIQKDFIAQCNFSRLTVPFNQVASVIAILAGNKIVIISGMLIVHFSVDRYQLILGTRLLSRAAATRYAVVLQLRPLATCCCSRLPITFSIIDVIASEQVLQKEFLFTVTQSFCRPFLTKMICPQTRSLPFCDSVVVVLLWGSIVLLTVKNVGPTLLQRLIIMTSLPSGVEVEWLGEYSYCRHKFAMCQLIENASTFFLQPKNLTLPAIFALETWLLNGIQEVRNIQEQNLFLDPFKLLCVKFHKNQTYKLHFF